MALDGIAVMRWVHVLAALTWVGFALFLALVVVPGQARMPPAARVDAIPAITGPGLRWAVGAADLAVLSGIGLGERLYWQYGNVAGDDAARTLLAGAVLGLVMLGIAHGVLVPRQKRIVRAAAEGRPPTPQEAASVVAAGRAVVALSFPTLFFMVMAGHGPLGVGELVASGVVLVAAAWGLIWYVQTRDVEPAT